MDAFIHQVLAGLATGGIYASLALALVMIYQATHLVNFAQGEMAMFATYIAWALINAGMPYWPAFFLTVAIAFVFGILKTVNEKERVSMLVVEQNAAMALNLADHAYLIETGRVVLSGTAQEIKTNDAVRRSYLGY